MAAGQDFRRATALDASFVPASGTEMIAWEQFKSAMLGGAEGQPGGR